MRRSGSSASSGGRNRSDVRGRWLAAGGCRRHRAVGSIVPGLERRLDERRQRERLLRATVLPVPVATEAAPRPAAESTTHHLAHRIATPATLSPEDRQAQAQPTEHRQFPLPIFRVVHFVLLHRIQPLLSLILPRACERPVNEPGPRCGDGGFTTGSCRSAREYCPYAPGAGGSGTRRPSAAGTGALWQAAGDALCLGLRQRRLDPVGHALVLPDERVGSQPQCLRLVVAADLNDDGMRLA